jgi:flagellar hook protein FlgE
MASTTAMYTGLSGLNANARMLDVVGNNIANVNTTAFKSNRMLFASQFSRNLSLGSEPTDVNGGSNPAQIGLGVTIAGTQRNFNTGSLNSTGDSRDLAIEGDGFFIVNRSGNTLYTRAGAFRQDAANNLVTVGGERVQGYAVDANFNLVSGSLTTLNIPVGQARLVQATSNVNMTGNFNTSGTLPSRATRSTVGPLLDTSAAAATAATLLTAVDNPSIAGSQPMYAVGQSIELRGAQKGGKDVPTQRLDVTATTTVGDLMTFLQNGLGIHTGVPNPDATTPGVTISAAGLITVQGNAGTANDIRLLPDNIRLLTSAGVTVAPQPQLAIAKPAVGDGESVRTTFVAYDSLGNEVRVDATVVLESRTGGSGTTWRYFIDSPDNAGGPFAVPGGTGTLRFDENGVLDPSNAGVQVSISRNGTGAASPLSFSLTFSSSGSVVRANNARSELAMFSQDGFPVGVLNSYSVGQDGTITGSFSNGRTRTVGQVALAKFSNAEGLVDIGGNLFAVGPASGNPVVTTPTTGGTGRIVGGALEQSNVDLAQEFINLIQAQTGYSAAGRVISTTDQLIQQLLVIGR